MLLARYTYSQADAIRTSQPMLTIPAEAPAAIQETMKYIIRTVILITKKNPGVGAEDIGHSFLSFCYSYGGDLDEMNKAMSAMLGEKEVTL